MSARPTTPASWNSGATINLNDAQNCYNQIVANLSEARRELDEGHIEDNGQRFYNDTATRRAHRIIIELCDGLKPMVRHD